MYSTSFSPARFLLNVFDAVFVGHSIDFGKADAISAESGFPGSGFGMDVEERRSTVLAFAAGNAEGPTVVAGWDRLWAIRNVKLSTIAIIAAGTEERRR